MPLPEPSPSAKAHSQKCLQHIIAKIAAKGSISFAEYMNLALYAPGLGYYSAGAQKFGKNGDFITAPEISPLFAQCLAKHMQPLLNELKQPTIMELGAGSGRLASDLILTLTESKQLPTVYYILEVSADLKQRQQKLLQQTCPGYFKNIHWLDKMPSDPFNGIIFGNEVIDAMPIECFEITQDEVWQRTVVADNGQLQWGQALSNKKLQDSVKELSISAENYQSEINLDLKPWLKALGDCLASGELLFIDYGFSEYEYYHPQRCTGTLMCHYRHFAHHDPFLYPGLQDITAHVDFTAIAIAADELGLDVTGYTTQAAFLMDCDIASLAKNQPPLVASKAIQTLTFPHEMGDLFKVISIGKNYTTEPLGFSHNILDKL